VPTLQLPTTDLQESFLAGVAEFVAEGRGGPDDDSMLGHWIHTYSSSWQTAAGFSAFVDYLLADRLEQTPRDESWVPCTTWWYVDGDHYLGRLALRHRLNPHLLEVAGHIGYDVRPSARRRGHATAMLHEALPLAAELGIEQALLTCDVDNVGSYTVIEANGGVLEDIRQGKRRYWVPTG
jgi:predicted acetyltransferase